MDHVSLAPESRSRRFLFLTAEVGQASDSAQLEPRRCKIFQVDGSLGILLKAVESGRLLFFQVPLVSPLLVADRSTAEGIGAVLTAVTDNPFWPTFKEAFPHHIDVVSCDAYSANLKYEQSTTDAHAGRPRLISLCAVHALSTIQGRVYGTQPNMISGLIATSLAMKTAGATRIFRLALQRILKASVKVHQQPPPGPDDPRRVYRDAVLAVVHPTASQRLVLEACFNGDWASESIDWFSPEGGDVEHWAAQAAQALLPHALPTFQRHRWLTKTEALTDAALLALCHNLSEP